MSFLSRFNPKDGIVDFWGEFSRPNPHRWPVLLVSILITTGLFTWITQDKVVGDPIPYKVEYITSFSPDRSEDEIVEGNIANQQRKDELERILAEREERKRELYRALGRAAGMDVERIEREAAEEAAQVQAEAARKRREITERAVAQSAE